MSEIKARYVGHPDGIEGLYVPIGDGEETRRVNIPYGGELPTEIDGQSVPASFRDSLLEQKDQWTQVKRQTAKAEKKEDED